MKIGEECSKKIVIMDFTGIYSTETFYEGTTCIWLDLRGVQGTNCYCDREAEAELRERIREFGAEGLHFLDLGNYHYASKLWFDMVEEDFELLVFDHHTDMQEPMFGDILSCGGWIKVALDTNPHLKRVWLVGPNEEGVKEAETMGFGERLVCICERDMEYVDRWREGLGNAGLPLYISVDKDVLSQEDARTNWDQGTARLSVVLDIIRAAGKMRHIIGMDVCGENSEEAGNGRRGAGEVTVNDRTNQDLVAVFQEVCLAGAGIPGSRGDVALSDGKITQRK